MTPLLVALTLTTASGFAAYNQVPWGSHGRMHKYAESQRHLALTVVEAGRSMPPRDDEEVWILELPEGRVPRVALAEGGVGDTLATSFWRLPAEVSSRPAEEDLYLLVAGRTATRGLTGVLVVTQSDTLRYEHGASRKEGKR